MKTIILFSIFVFFSVSPLFANINKNGLKGTYKSGSAQALGQGYLSLSWFGDFIFDEDIFQNTQISNGRINSNVDYLLKSEYHENIQIDSCFFNIFLSAFNGLIK